METAGIRLADDPIGFFGHSFPAMHALGPAELEALHLQAAKYRLEQLLTRLPVLAKLAAGTGFQGVTELNDLVPLLFEHTMYKGYPASLLLNRRFDKLTQWLGKLTTVELSHIDATQCGSIDEWIALLRRESPIRLCHSSGTSGTMSFLPLHEDELDIRFGLQTTAMIRERCDGFTAMGTPDDPLNMHILYPYFRSGGKAILLGNDSLARCIAGDEERFRAAYPGRVSSDLDYLATRLNSAAAKGLTDEVEVPPALLARKAELEELHRTMPAHLKAFFGEAIQNLAGQRVFILGTFNLLYDMAITGLSNGISNVFAKDSFVLTGGGAKGATLPADWQERVKEFIGVDWIQMAYGMSETSGVHAICEHGNYHLCAWQIPFILDLETGAPLPRSGIQKGRSAFLDLAPRTRWGGFVTGDEVTFNFDGGCSCGRATPFYTGKIERVGASQGGDDKINCAATPDAQSGALEYLNNLAV